MNVKHKDGMALVEMVGRIIYDNLALTQEQLEELVASDLSQLYLRMNDLDYLDSSALGMLLSLNKSARQTGKEIMILAPPPNIMEVFTSTHLDNIFKILGDAEAETISAGF